VKEGRTGFGGWPPISASFSAQIDVSEVIRDKAMGSDTNGTYFSDKRLKMVPPQYLRRPETRDFDPARFLYFASMTVGFG